MKLIIKELLLILLTEVVLVFMMISIAEKEKKMENVSVRKHRGGDMGMMDLKSFVRLIKEEISKNISNFEN